MVQAILENRKTMTRRTNGLEEVNKNPNDWKFDRYAADMAFDQIGVIFSNDNEEIYIPFKANVGDVFWVRENYYTASNWDHWKPSMLKSVNVEVFYVADLPNYDIPRPLSRGKIRPCIFLPKEYSRIFLKIKSIRVERLQDISEEDAKAEGVSAVRPGLWYNYLVYDSYWTSPVYSFETLWISINGKESMNLNPFVFVYEFEQIEKHLDFIV